MSGIAYEAIRRGYNRIRHRLPRVTHTYAGIEARDGRLLDQTTSHPDYKAGLIDAIHQYATGRDVELVGFGRGVSTVAALRGGALRVTAYEAADEMIPIGVETVLISDCEVAQIRVRHALVGPAIDVYGDASEATRVNPDILSSDLLILDCEGAELEILEEQDDLPAPVAIVETHPTKGASTNAVRRRLEGTGYEEIDRRDYEPDGGEKDVLVGRTA